jgi:hypothetical protein
MLQQIMFLFRPDSVIDSITATAAIMWVNAILLLIILLLLTEILIECDKYNVTICINFKELKIILIFPGRFKNNFLIVLHNTTGYLILKLLI